MKSLSADRSKFVVENVGDSRWLVKPALFAVDVRFDFLSIKMLLNRTTFP